MAQPVDRMARLDDYQRRVDEAVRKASEATTLHDRDQWMQVAQAWSALIETIKRSQQNP